MNKAESKYFRTAEKMDQALLSLLETKPFEYITVSEICKKAEVNRSTFYLHYESLHDLLAETSSHLVEGFLAYFPADRSAIASGFSRGDLTELNYITEEYLHPYLSYIKENQRIFSTALKYGAFFGFEAIFQRMFQRIFDPILDRFGYPVGDRNYVIRFYLTGLHAVVGEWLKDGCSKSIEDLSRIMQECIFGLGK